jgi:ABC-type uncharacterized transport system permease subunit
MTLPTLDPVAIGAVAGVTTVIVQAILTLGNFDAVTSNRWGPVLAGLIVGPAIALLDAFASGPVTNQILATAVLTGVAGGFGAMGVHNFITKSVVGTTAANVIGVQSAEPPPA